MTTWFYFSFGFALLSLFLQGETKGGGRRRLTEIARSALLLTLILGIVLLFDYFLTATLWRPAGRSDFRWISVALAALAVDGSLARLQGSGTGSGTCLTPGQAPLAAVTISLWTVSTGDYLLGLTLPLGIGVSEGLLAGLTERLRLSTPPVLLQGAPLLFWLAMLLALAVCQAGA